MRVFASCVVVTLCAACGHVAPPPVPPSQGDISRSRAELPAGYEIGDLAGRSSPVAFWGLGRDWTADPPRCGALSEPVAPDAPVRGWSASGPGGIVYAAVVDSAAAFDPTLVGECGTFTVSAGHTSAAVALVRAPQIDGASTVGMVADAHTLVEGGTETRSRAETLTAYLDGRIATVTVLTDPGAAGPALGRDFTETLLERTVSAVRGG